MQQSFEHCSLGSHNVVQRGAAQLFAEDRQSRAYFNVVGVAKGPATSSTFRFV